MNSNHTQAEPEAKKQGIDLDAENLGSLIASGLFALFFLFFVLF
jgi:hypothetical protein